MEQRNLQVIWNKRASKSLMKLHKFIAEKNPENAARYVQRMIEFGDSLGFLPEKFPHNRFNKFAHLNYYTAVFEKNFLFFYKVNAKNLHICAIINTKRLK